VSSADWQGPDFTHGDFHADSTSAFEFCATHMVLGEALQHSIATHFLHSLIIRFMAMDLCLPMGMGATEGDRLSGIWREFNRSTSVSSLSQFLTSDILDIEAVGRNGSVHHMNTCQLWIP
jgi:hypothetical protein